VRLDDFLPVDRHDLVSGFSVLGYLAAGTYRDAPPVPRRVADPAGATLFTGQDIIGGQQIFLSHGLMENGSIWGHGAYLGPDFSAEYLHTMALDIRASVSAGMRSNSIAAHPNDPNERNAEVASILKQNRYEPTSGTLTFTKNGGTISNRGLTAGLIKNPEELRKLTAFFAWAAWASAARRPGKVYSYTNNFPYDPLAGNVPTSDAVLWSAMSLLMLLAGIAAVLFRVWPL
jgi:nitric oxide reductase subunit B